MPFSEAIGSREWAPSAGGRAKSERHGGGGLPPKHTTQTIDIESLGRGQIVDGEHKMKKRRHGWILPSLYQPRSVLTQTDCAPEAAHHAR